MSKFSTIVLFLFFSNFHTLIAEQPTSFSTTSAVYVIGDIDGAYISPSSLLCNSSMIAAETDDFPELFGPTKNVNGANLRDSGPLNPRKLASFTDEK